MVIFPEGTRYNPLSTDIIEKSRSFAEERGMLEDIFFILTTWSYTSTFSRVLTVTLFAKCYCNCVLLKYDLCIS